MAFQKVVAGESYPPRLWSLAGYPNSGKSSFALRMRGPIVVVDADHRIAETVRQTGTGNVYQLGGDPADMTDPRRIAAGLKRDMRDSGIRTIVVDSLTAIIAPVVSEAMAVAESGESTNRIAPFKAKAMAMRTLQHAVSAYGTDTLWIFHYRDIRNAKAEVATANSVSTVELARLRASLNMELSTVRQGDHLGIRIDWARTGRSGLVLWDESGTWLNMPERIEEAAYSGLSAMEREAIAKAAPAVFPSPAAAIAWAHEQKAFNDAVHAQAAYEKLRREAAPDSAAEMAQLWVADVQRRLTERLQVAA